MRITAGWQISALAAALIAAAACSKEKPSAGDLEAVFAVSEKEELQRLSHPAALRLERPRSYGDLRAQFADPPAEYRTMPLWVWNDEMRPDRMREQLAQFRQQGMGGVFIHPRPGLVTEYLSEDWFRLWGQALEEGRRLGLLVNIYDENSYPSGFAGGHVPALAPDTASQFVQAEWTDAVSNPKWRRAEILGLYAARRNARGEPEQLRPVSDGRELRPGESLLVFRLRRAGGNPWTGHFPYVDLTDPETTRLFLATTYEAYRSRFGREFGRTIRWIFCDEPLLATAGAYDSAPLALPLSPRLLAEFQRRNGYDLSKELPSLFWDVGPFRQVRFDYWQTLHDLWRENFMRPMFLWCDRNGVQWTGHWMEHTWPEPWISPADASFYAYQHVPGIDMLESQRYRVLGGDPHLLFTIRQVASVAHQLGRRAFVEAYGVAGWDSTLEFYKSYGDWLLVHGINFLDQHLSFTTIRGARKRDHPQSFSDHAAWWPYYRVHADHVARVSLVSSGTEPRNRVLVLTPTTSGFLLARRAGPLDELERLRTENGELNQLLADNQIDFDVGDEYILEWFGSAAEGRLQVGQARYELLVLPGGLINLRRQTLGLLERYLAGGGRVLALGPAPAYVDGRPDARPAELQRRYAGQWQTTAAGQLPAEIRRRVPARVELDRPAPRLGLLERFTREGDRVLFFANSAAEPVRVRVSVAGQAAELWDTLTGGIRPLAVESAGSGRIAFPLELEPGGSLLAVVRDQPGPAPAPPAAVRETALAAGPWRVRAEGDNVLVLDYGLLRAHGRDYGERNTWDANWILWQLNGFERPAWDNAIQFRRRILDRNHFGPDSGFRLEFRFEAAPGAETLPLRLAVEQPALYQISVNGTDVGKRRRERWLDPSIEAIDIGGLLRPGANSVVIEGRPFDVRMELENIYVLGPFAVEPAQRGFRLAPARALDFGPWRQQGWPFYSGTVLYEADVEVPAGTSRLKVELNGWAGAAAEVLLDGQRVALIAWKPYRAEFPVQAGRRRLAIRVAATPRNLLGPFHHPEKPRMRAWPAAWAEFPPQQPAGADYDLLDYGLLSPPAIRGVSEN